MPLRDLIKKADNSIAPDRILEGDQYDIKIDALLGDVIALADALDTRTGSGTAGGDLSGTYPNPLVVKLRGKSIPSAAPTTGDYLNYDGTSWIYVAGPPTGTGTFANVTVNNSGTAVPSATNLATASSGKGLGIICGNGNTVSVLNTADSGTSAATLDVFTLSLANDATFDYPPGLGGSMLVSVPGATSCPMAHIGFAANASPTLNGVTPAGGISLTLDNATTLNIYASGGNVRFQNKVGSTISVLVSATKFLFA